MSPPGPVAIGVDIGGTRLRAAAVADDGSVVARESTLRPPNGQGPEAFGSQVVANLVEMVGRLGTGVPVGIGIASLVDLDGRLVDAPNLGIEGFALRERAGEALGTDVTVVNDATAACLAEARLGAGQGHDDVVLVTVGTGVGGGAVVGGRLLRGAHGLAAEFGHITVVDGGRPCPCGAHGCLEAYAAGRAVGAIAAERLAEGRASPALAGEAHVDGAAVTRAASTDDPLAVEVITEAGHWLGVGLAGVVNALDPAIVVLGGGAGQAMGTWLLPPARSAMAAGILGRGRRRPPPIEPAVLGDDAGVVGAALLAVDRCTAP